MTHEKTKKAVVVSSFRDAGTGRSYTTGDVVSLTEGEFLNFSNAGLVREPDVKDKGEARAEA